MTATEPNQRKSHLMNSHIIYALAHPVFDPERQITLGHYWQTGDIRACLTSNIGME